MAVSRLGNVIRKEPAEFAVPIAGEVIKEPLGDVLACETVSGVHYNYLYKFVIGNRFVGIREHVAG